MMGVKYTEKYRQGGQGYGGEHAPSGRENESECGGEDGLYPRRVPRTRNHNLYLILDRQVPVEFSSSPPLTSDVYSKRSLLMLNMFE